MATDFAQKGPMSRGGVVGIGLLLAALTLAVYARSCTRDFGFIDLDDPEYVTANPNVLGGLSLNGLRWAGTTFHANNWHPLTWISLQLDAELYGPDARGFHFTNLLLHTLNTLLLFWLLCRATGAVWCSAAVAAFFGLHPTHVESVAWVTERKDVLSTLFLLLTIIAYLSYAKRPTIGRYLSVATFLALGLMAKPMLATLPALLLLLDYWPLRRWPGRIEESAQLAPASIGRLVIEKLPLFFLVAITLPLTLPSGAQQDLMRTLDQISFSVRFENALVSYVKYVGMMFWPNNLAILYPHPQNSIPNWQPFAAVASLAGLTVVAWWVKDRAPYLIVGWLWFLGTLVPVIGLVPVGVHEMADRYTYVSSIGLLIAVVWGVAAATAKWRARIQPLALLTVCLTLACGIWTWMQVGHWRSAEAVWRRALAVTRNNYVAHERLGMILFKKGELEAAHRHFTTAAQLVPDSATVHVNLGSVFEQMVMLNEAAEQFAEAVRLDPKSVPGHLGMGRLFEEMRRLDDALRHYETVLKIHPESTDARVGVGGILERNGDLVGAATQYELARRTRPDRPAIYLLIGRVLRRQGKPDAAVAQCEIAIEMAPRFADAHNSKGVIREGQKRLADARASYRHAVELEPANLLFRCNLAYVCYEMGDIREAAAHYGETFRIGPNWPELVMREAWIKATHTEAVFRNGAEALRTAKLVCQATEFQMAQSLDVLAAAHAELGEFAEAVAWMKKAISLAPRDTPAAILVGLLDRLKLYENRKPFRRTPSL